jgi:hypothetical protein
MKRIYPDSEKHPVGKIYTDNLAPGMTLGADVRDRSGRLLLGSGTELSERHLYILKTWGVVEVEITGTDEESIDPHFEKTIDSAILARIEKEITPLFRYADNNHPAIKELMHLRILREAEHGNL